MGGRSAPTWGWHRLDRSWADRLVSEAGVRPGDLVVDVGAGDGVVALALLRAGARVVAVELHPGRAAGLRRRLAGEDAVVVQADARDLRLPRRPFSVVANPPWGQTDAVLRRLLHPASRVRRVDVLVKRSTARRWAEGRVDGGRSARLFRFDLGPTVPRRAFSPQPRIDGRVLRIVRM